jgi:hypothetical protein
MVWSAIAAAAMLLVLAVAAGIILRLTNTNGTIELVNLPRDAEVSVDGERATVTWSGAGEPALISLTPGKRMLRVKKAGFQMSGAEVTIEAGGREAIIVRLLPLADSGATRDGAGADASRSDLARPRTASSPVPQNPPAQTTTGSSTTAPPALTKKHAVVPSANDRFDPDAPYRFVASFQPRKSLDVRPNGRNTEQAILAETSDRSAQQWKIVPLGDGWYRITSNGHPGKCLGLRHIGGHNAEPILADTNDDLGQHWKITAMRDGWHRITSRIHPAQSLDIVNDGKNNRLKMAPTGNWTGQFWKITVSR